jgi:transposase
MAAQTASRYNAPLASFYQRLLSKGKTPKLALVAVMRKLLTVLNAIARSKQPWAAVLPASSEILP